jgi:hypothetical protein
MFALMADPTVSAAPRLVLAEAQRFPAIARLYRREVVSIGERALGELFSHAAAQGRFRAVPQPAALRAVIGPMIAHVLLTHVFVDPDQPGPDPVATADAIADILLNGLKPRPPSPDEAAP